MNVVLWFFFNVQWRKRILIAAGLLGALTFIVREGGWTQAAVLRKNICQIDQVIQRLEKQCIQLQQQLSDHRQIRFFQERIARETLCLGYPTEYVYRVKTSE